MMQFLTYRDCFGWNLLPKESGESSVHPSSRRMGKFSGKNTTRDFWRFCKTPIAAQRYDSLRWGVIPLIGNLTVLKTTFLFYPKKTWSILRLRQDLVFWTKCKRFDMRTKDHNIVPNSWFVQLRKLSKSKSLWSARQRPKGMKCMNLESLTQFRWWTTFSTRWASIFQNRW